MVDPPQASGVMWSRSVEQHPHHRLDGARIGGRAIASAVWRREWTVTSPIQAAQLYEAIELAMQRPSPVPAADGAALILDETAILLGFEGDVSIMRDAIQSFLDDLPVRLAEGLKAAAAHDLARLASIAHTIKGSVGYFGAQLTVDAAATLEAAARAGEGDRALTAYATLLAVIGRLDVALTSLLA